MTELIVREISATMVNLTSIAVGGIEDLNNAGRFFNNQPFSLVLVAFRLGAILQSVTPFGNASVQSDLFGVVELSRQALIFQQEGILGSVRATYNYYRDLIVNGPASGIGANNGEMLYGNFKDEIMTLEEQNNIFLNLRVANGAESTLTKVAGEVDLLAGATLYFRKGRVSR